MFNTIAYQSLLAQIELAIKARQLDYAQGMVQALSVLGWLNSEEIAAYKDAIDAAIIEGLSHE